MMSWKLGHSSLAGIGVPYLNIIGTGPAPPNSVSWLRTSGAFSPARPPLLKKMQIRASDEDTVPPLTPWPPLMDMQIMTTAEEDSVPPLSQWPPLPNMQITASKENSAAPLRPPPWAASETDGAFFHRNLGRIDKFLGQTIEAFVSNGTGRRPDDPYLITSAMPFFSDDCNRLINELMSLQYSVALVYDGLAKYFIEARHLQNIAILFCRSKRRVRDDLDVLLHYQSKRKGETKVLPTPLPITGFGNSDRVDASIAFEIAIYMEDLIAAKLIDLLTEAENCDDLGMEEFLSLKFMDKQIEVMEKMAECAAHLESVGEDNDGVKSLDAMILRERDGRTYR